MKKFLLFVLALVAIGSVVRADDFIKFVDNFNRLLGHAEKSVEGLPKRSWDNGTT